MAKLKDIIAYLAKHYPHKDELSNARLTKMVYLADWHQAIRHKRQISNISWVFDNYGPYVHDIVNTASSNSNQFKVINDVNAFGHTKRLIQLKDPTYEPILTEEEKNSLDHVINETKKMYWSEFIKLVYSTHPVATSERYSRLNLVEKAGEYAVN